MAHYPNQKHFTINRINPLMAKKQYLSITCENIAEASRRLSGEIPFKFYLYLCSNQDNYSFDYSPQHFANIYGVSLDSARRAPEKLIEAGYLVPSEKHKNGFDFFEIPQEKKTSIKINIVEEKRLFEQEDGSMKAMTYLEVYNELKEQLPESYIKEQVWNIAEVAQ